MAEVTVRQSFRQGDVLIIPCDSIPAGACEEGPENGRVVLARGEHTGHSHTMDAGRVRYFREDGTGGGGYLRLDGDDPVDLTHEEHAPLAIPPGTYRVIRQREYQPKALPRIVGD